MKGSGREVITSNSPEFLKRRNSSVRIVYEIRASRPRNRGSTSGSSKIFLGREVITSNSPEFLKRRNGSVGIVYGIRASRPRNRGSTPGNSNRFSLLHSLKISSVLTCLPVNVYRFNLTGCTMAEIWSWNQEFMELISVTSFTFVAWLLN